MDSIHHIGAAAKQFGWLLPVVLSIPECITTRVDKGMAAFAKMQNVRLATPSSSFKGLKSQILIHITDTKADQQIQNRPD